MSFRVQNKVSWHFRRVIRSSEIRPILFLKIFSGLNFQLKKSETNMPLKSSQTIKESRKGYFKYFAKNFLVGCP